MTKNDAIVSKDLLEIFGLKLHDKLAVKFDLLGLLPPSYDDVQTIVFDYFPFTRTMPTKG